MKQILHCRIEPEVIRSTWFWRAVMVASCSESLASIASEMASTLDRESVCDITAWRCWSFSEHTWKNFHLTFTNRYYWLYFTNLGQNLIRNCFETKNSLTANLKWKSNRKVFLFQIGNFSSNVILFDNKLIKIQVPCRALQHFGFEKIGYPHECTKPIKHWSLQGMFTNVSHGKLLSLKMSDVVLEYFFFAILMNVWVNFFVFEDWEWQ